jgi:hypothetical protein
VHEVQYEVDEPAAVELEDDGLSVGFQDPAIGAALEEANNSPPPIEEQEFHQTSEGHIGAVTSMCSLILAGKNPVGIIATGGVDGSVMLWKDTESPILAGTFSTPSKSPITSLCALSGFPCFAVGTADGVLRIVHVAGRGSIDSDAGDLKMVTVYVRAKRARERSERKEEPGRASWGLVGARASEASAKEVFFCGRRGQATSFI